ncbi:hypothetical protein [Agromyces humi]|uniref:hypothetical protein n=1 Tax=Agromyces humi TaxID=1766800 RepID=UPI00135AA888|nr:hypothetical protein [Agromyces humi]
MADDALQYALRAECEAPLDLFAAANHELVEWWTFTVVAFGEPDDDPGETAAVAQVAVIRNLDDDPTVWWTLLDSDSADLAEAGAGLHEKLLEDPDWFADTWADHLVIVDHVTVEAAHRGRGLSGQIIQAIERMFPDGLLILIPSDLDERGTVPADPAHVSPADPRRSPENYRKLREHWQSVGFEDLAGKTMYLPRERG